MGRVASASLIYFHLLWTFAVLDKTQGQLKGTDWPQFRHAEVFVCSEVPFLRFAGGEWAVDRVIAKTEGRSQVR